MNGIRRIVVLSIGLILFAGSVYWVYGYAKAESRMRATCEGITPGMAFDELKEFALRHDLRPPRRDNGVMYLAEDRSFGRHACKVLLEAGIVKESEHNFAD